MKNFKTINLAMLALLALAAMHCYPELVQRIITIRDETRPFFDFGAGSWWRYVNDSTGQVDSMYLNQITTNWHYSEDENFSSERESVNLQLVSQVHLQSLGAGFIAYTSGEIGSFAAGVPFGTTFETPNPINPSRDPSGDVDYIGFSPSVLLGGQTFTDVYEYYCPDGNILNDSSAAGRFFYKKNVGLIHWRLEGTDTSWTVTDYQIF
jgi:hypothetical protein